MINVNPRSVFLLILLSSCIQLSAQTLKWAVGSNCPHGVVESWPVAVDQAGNVYETGYSFPAFSSIPYDSVKTYFGGDTLRGSGGIIVSTDSNGHKRWTKEVLNCQISSMCVGPYGELFVFGNFNNSLTIGTHVITSTAYATGFAAKMDTSGNVIWLKKVADSCYPCGTVDAAGNIIIGSSYYSSQITIGASTFLNTGPAGTKDVFISKFDSSGSPVWTKTFGGTLDENIRSVACAPTGDIFIGGGFLSSSFTIGGSTIVNPSGGTIYYTLIAKYDTYGVPAWGNYGADSGIGTTTNWVSADAWGDVYITGLYIGRLSFGTDTLPRHTYFALYLAKYRSNGSLSWAATMNDQRYHEGFSVSNDLCGNVWFSGNAANTTTTDGMFLFHYDTAGTFVDSTIYAEGGDDQNVVLCDNKGNLYLAGDYTYGDFVIGSDTLLLTDATEEALFIAKYQYPFCSLPTLNTPGEKEALKEINLFPNPAYDECTISLSGSGGGLSRAELFDITGRFAGLFPLSGKSAVISLKDTRQGIYLCRIYTEDNAVTTRKLVVTK